jgi:hypothetical protein
VGENIERYVGYRVAVSREPIVGRTKLSAIFTTNVGQGKSGQSTTAFQMFNYQFW